MADPHQMQFSVVYRSQRQSDQKSAHRQETRPAPPFGLAVVVGSGQTVLEPVGQTGTVDEVGGAAELGDAQSHGGLQALRTASATSWTGSRYWWQ